MNRRLKLLLLVLLPLFNEAAVSAPVCRPVIEIVAATAGVTSTAPVATRPRIEAKANEVYVVRIHGQSNGQGIVPIADTPALTPSLSRVFSRVYVWHGTSWQNLHLGVNSQGQNVGSQYGPIMGVAQKFEQEYPTGDLYIICEAAGATNISFWEKATNLGYNNIIDSWRGGYRELRNAHPYSDIKMVAELWIQGESDESGTAVYYEGALTQLFADQLTDEAIDRTTLHIISETTTNSGEVELAEHRYVNKTPQARFMHTTDVPKLDALHYSNTGVMQIGCRFFNMAFGTTGGINGMSFTP